MPLHHFLVFFIPRTEKFEANAVQKGCLAFAIDHFSTNLD
jgi:hypothetical protein